MRGRIDARPRGLAVTQPQLGGRPRTTLGGNMSPVSYPPGPRSRYPGAHLLAFGRDPLGFLTRVAREYGDIAHGRLGRKHLYLLNHPDDIKDVLVTYHRRFTGLAFEAGKRLTGEGLLSAQGEAHRRQRRLLQTAFHRDPLPADCAGMVPPARG